MSAYRCNPCSALWPPTSEFRICPECKGKTDLFSNADPMPVDEAISRKNHADFDRYCEERDNRRLAAELKQLAP